MPDLEGLRKALQQRQRTPPSADQLEASRQAMQEAEQRLQSQPATTRVLFGMTPATAQPEVAKRDRPD